MEYPLLIFLHVLFGTFWAGAAVALGFFILPAVLEAGPGGGAVMAGVIKRRLPIYLTVAAVIVALTGLRLYMIRFTTPWLTSAEGIVLTLGALLAIAAFVMGLTVQKPSAERLGALAAQVAASGAPPTPAQAAEMQALRQRLGRIARVTGWHLIAASALMASHRWAALL